MYYQITSHAMQWHAKTFMEANPTKFQSMPIKSFTRTEVIPAYIEISDVHIKCEMNIKLLGNNDKLKFDNHVVILC